MSDAKVFICQRQRSELSPSGKTQLHHFAQLTTEQKQKIKAFICRESWLKDVIEKYMPNVAAIVRLEYFFVYLTLYVSHGKGTLSFNSFDQSNPCVRATIEFIRENHKWLEPMINYYVPLLKNSLLERNFRKLMRETERETDSLHGEWDSEKFKEFMIQLTELFVVEKRAPEAAGGARPKRRQIKVPKEFWGDLEYPPQTDRSDDEFVNSPYFESRNDLPNFVTKRVARRDGYTPSTHGRNARRQQYRSKSVDSMSPGRHLTDKAFSKVFTVDSNNRLRPKKGRRARGISVEKLLKNVDDGRQRQRQRHRSTSVESVSPMRRLNSSFVSPNEFKNSKLRSKLFAPRNENLYSKERQLNGGELERFSSKTAGQRRQGKARQSQRPPSWRRYPKNFSECGFPKPEWDSDPAQTENERYAYSRSIHKNRGSDIYAEHNLPRPNRRQRYRSSSVESESPVRPYNRTAFSPDDEYRGSKLHSKYLEDDDDFAYPRERREPIGNIYTLNDVRLNSPYKEQDYFYDDDWR